jgi:hypothetical protein
MTKMDPSVHSVAGIHEILSAACLSASQAADPKVLATESPDIRDSRVAVEQL